MTLKNIIDNLGDQKYIILGYFSMLLLISAVGFLFKRYYKFKSPLNYVYSIILYLVVIPGTFASLLLLYHFFFLKGNLLLLDIYVHYLPIVFMVITLLLINKTTELKNIPGFDRLSGFILLVALAFVITFILQRLFFGVVFIANVGYLLFLFGLILFGLKVGWNKLKQ